MPDLTFTVQSYTATQLAIKLKNTSTGPLDKPLTIEFFTPKYLVSQQIRDAAEAAPQSPLGVTTLDTVVTGVEGTFSVWAKPETSGAFVSILLINDRDKTGAQTPPTSFAAGAELTILIPLDRNASHPSVNLPYFYEYDVNPIVAGELELPGTDPEWVPKVTLTSNQTSPTMISPRTDVKISWKIQDGVSATLRGPLPGGKTEWTLSDSAKTSFKMSEGFFEFKATGPVTYMLQAEVKRPDGQPNVEVVRMISLDVYTKGKYAFLEARPLRVLPQGLVELEWAAWGTNTVTIYAGDASRKIPLTDMTLSGFLQGAGVMRVTASKTVTKTDVTLVIEVDKKPKVETETHFDVVQWKTLEKSQFTGQLLGLAVAAPKMALLTTDGLWIAKVGDDDFDGGDVTQLAFSRPATTDRPKAWRALAALGQRFVALRQTNDNDLQVAFFNSQGNPDEVLPIDLPADMRRFMGSGTPIDLVVCAGRAYITAEALFMSGPVRRAFSVGINSATKKAEFRPEPLLETMVGYRLLGFDDALYAVHRRSGQMFRFRVTPEGKLEPYKAAPAVGQDATSMVQDALLVPVGHVLAVLSPNSIPSLVSLAKVGLQNVLRYQNLNPLKAPATITQDVVYSPQGDRWVRCGHGLDVKAGVVAFREGDSPRLWLIEPNGNTYTLTVGSEHLFLHDYVTDLPAKRLDPFLNKQRQFKIRNNTAMKFVPMAENETCRRAGVTPFSATGPVEMISALPDLRTGITETFDLRYNEADPPSTTLRFLIQRPGGIKNEYFLELTLSGADLSTATTVFKRIATDRLGNLSIAEVPGTRQQHSTADEIVFSAKPLTEGIKLTAANRTPYQLWLRSPEARDEAAREKPFDGEIVIMYDTPAFSIYAHGAGEVFFEVDFALPSGIEISWNPDERPAKRIRANISNSRGLNIDSISIQETPSRDIYKCDFRYNYWKPQAGVYIGDGAITKDGASLYVPLASLSGARSEVIKMRTADLLIEASITQDGGNVFSTPNSIAVLADKVLGIFRINWLSQLTPALKSEGGMPLYWHDVVTNLKGSTNENKFYTVGMKQESANPPRYSYSYASRSYSQPSDEVEMLLDQLKGFRPARVPGAPAWVSPNTISPMDVNGGVAFAICVEGGVFAGDVKSKRIIEIPIDGAGREEAVVLDPIDLTIFCAHARQDNTALMISRINPSNPSDKLTITLPSPVVDMVTDTNPPVGPNLRYNRPRAVSLIVMPDVLFVSHGTKIYVLDKKRLTERQQLTLDLPCRISGVRRMKAPGETHPRYGTPADCYMVFAIGSMYVGDGQSRSKYQTNLYKLAVVV